MEELGKWNLKINVIPNGLEKYMKFIVDNKLRFNDSFQFLSPSLDNLVKNLDEDDFEYLRQELDNNVIGQVKEKGVYLSLWIYQRFWKILKRIALQRKVL